MATYNFKREATVYAVYGGNRHQLDVSEITFSQTFSEESYPVKTIHNQNNVFEGSIINKANVANFSLIIPALEEADFQVIEDRLLDVGSFDLYIQTAADIFKLENAVITNGSFVIEKSRPLSIGIEGEAAKLTRGATLQGTLQNRSSSRTYILPVVTVTLNNSSLGDIVRVNMELQNEVRWTPYTTVNNSLNVTNAGNSMYPSSFTLSKKILSGSITQYLTNSNTSNAISWDNDATLTVQAGDGSPFRGFKMGPATCSFTNRVGTGSVYTQNYDWRLVQNTTLSSILQYITD